MGGSPFKHIKDVLSILAHVFFEEIFENAGMLVFGIVRLTGNLIIDLGNQVGKPVTGGLVQLAMHVHGVIEQLLAFHLVKPAFMPDLTFHGFGRFPVGLIRNRHRHFDHNIRRAGRLLDQIRIHCTDLMPLLQQVDYRIAHHIIEQKPKQHYG